jgi:hypothetical protein
MSILLSKIVHHPKYNNAMLFAQQSWAGQPKAALRSTFSRRKWLRYKA